MKPRAHRLFLKWLEINHQRMAISITATMRTKGLVDIAFTGINPMISAHVLERGRYCSLSVFVLRKNDLNDCLDIVTDLDCVSVKTDGGFTCTLCEPGKQDKFPDLKSLMEDHLFEPFLEWVNGDLATAQWLGIWESDGGSSAAKLLKPIPDPSDADYELFPLRIEDKNSQPQIKT